MGYYTAIYDEARKQAVKDVRMWTRYLLHDTEEFEENEMELFEFCQTLDIITRELHSVADNICVARARDVATDLLIDDADFPQLYTDSLISKDRSKMQEVIDRIWDGGMVEDCSYKQVCKGVEQAWEELEQTEFDDTDGQE